MPVNDAAPTHIDDPVETPPGDAVDILGIGFGPANLALAIAVEERNAQLAPAGRIRARFVERQTEFGWHDGMLLPGATMQVSFLKDLVSQRSPTSTYSFLNYLHERGRLTDFINLKTFFPLRHEFHDYLRWAADRVDIPVAYGTTAMGVDHVDGGIVVTVRDALGGVEHVTAHSVVVGTGITPTVPDGLVPSRRVFHNHQLLAHLERIPSRTRKRFLVVGAGQSAAEVAAYLHATYPDSEVHASFRRFGYIPADDTPYANRIFDPGSIDEYYTAPPELKAQMLRLHGSTNYGAVDAELIQELYRREYDERLRGERRLHMHRLTEIERLDDGDDGVTVTLRDLGDRATTGLDVDAVVLATGFHSADPRDLFGPGVDCAPAIDGDAPIVARDYSLCIPGLEGRVFLNGGVEHSHGISSSLLSNLSLRAAEILGAATRSQRQYAHTSA